MPPDIVADWRAAADWRGRAPRARQGLPGEDGAPGRDGQDVDQAALEKLIAECVARAEALAPLPKDGDRGPRGPRGERGPQGDKGDEGEQGPAGPMPRHEWDGSRLRFQRPGGGWGDWVDLRGYPGQGGGVVQTGGSIDGLTISGGNTVGSILTAAFGEGVTGTVQWYRDGVEISGETALTYEIASDDLGATITARSTSIVFLSNEIEVEGGAEAPAGLDFSDPANSGYVSLHSIGI